MTMYLNETSHRNLHLISADFHLDTDSPSCKSVQNGIIQYFSLRNIGPLLASVDFHTPRAMALIRGYILSDPVIKMLDERLAEIRKATGVDLDRTQLLQIFLERSEVEIKEVRLFLKRYFLAKTKLNPNQRWLELDTATCEKLEEILAKNNPDQTLTKFIAILVNLLSKKASEQVAEKIKKSSKVVSMPRPDEETKLLKVTFGEAGHQLILDLEGRSDFKLAHLIQCAIKENAA